MIRDVFPELLNLCCCRDSRYELLQVVFEGIGVRDVEEQEVLVTLCETKTFFFGVRSLQHIAAEESIHTRHHLKINVSITYYIDNKE